MPSAGQFCEECGLGLPANAQFCEECGKAVPSSGLTNYTRTRELFDQAIAVDTASRQVWLQRNCGDDPALLAQLQSMFPAADDSFLAKPAELPPDLIPPIAPPPTPPPASVNAIGPYRLVRELGRGGMGVVFLAVRDDGAFRKNVALKLLLREQVTPEFVQRFKQERQVLAAMDHPNIARILDGGDAPDGMPYYVMEYVEGLPIDKYCDEQRLSLTGRIKIFQQVCQAANYLHQNSIVHRDLKPMNILVSGDGAVKLLDFGIAKVVGAGSYSNSDMTSVHGYPMTPNYASPEQIQGVTLQQTSDIYSLGVILYLLLTGRPPYEGWEDKKAKLADRKPPPSPSTNIREDLRATPESTAQLRKAMLGELDSIVLMALRYDSKDRYQSAADLSGDLQRFLDGQSVAAHHETVGPKSVRLIRRNRVAIAVLAGFLVLGGFGAWQWHRVETAKAEVVARETQIRALLDQLESTDPAKPEEEKIKDLEKLKKAFADELPAVAAAKPAHAAQHKELIERGVRYLDKLAATAPPRADLGLKLADAYQQLAVLQGSIIASTAATKAETTKTYQKAEAVLAGCESSLGDNRVADKLAQVRQRIQTLSGVVAQTEAVVKRMQEEQHPQTVAPQAQAVAQIPASSLKPSARPEVRPEVRYEPPATMTEAPRQEAPQRPIAASPALAELQDRVANVESRVMIAEQTIQPLKQNLEAQGQSLNANTLSDLSGMRVRLNQAKRYLAAGNESGARESLAAAQAFADRVMKSVGR